MTELNFTYNEDTKYWECSVPAFVGTLQVVRNIVGDIVISATLSEDMPDVVIYHEKSTTTLAHVNISDSLTLNIRSKQPVIKAGYVED